MPTQTPKRRSRSKSAAPFFGGGVLVDGAQEGAGGKWDCKGLYTTMYAWDYPAPRNIAVVFTVFTAGRKTKGEIGFRKRGARRADNLGKFTITSENVESTGSVHHFQAPCQVAKEGVHEIVLSLDRSASQLIIPVLIITRDWPRFTVAERRFVKKNPDVTHIIRATVHCPTCQHAYIIEEDILSETSPKGGVLRFPNGPSLTCDDCRQAIRTRDLQGRLRASLKERLRTAMAERL